MGERARGGADARAPACPAAACPGDVWRRHFDVEPGRVVYADARVVAFRDRSPKASSHLLVVPRAEEISGTEALRAAHAPLVAHMARVGRQLAPPGAPPVMGFHRRPLRSVDHLHLHVVTPPFAPAWQRLRYTQPPLLPVSFAEVSTVLQRLARDAGKQ